MTVQDVLDDIRKRPGTGEVIPIIDPATEEQITEFTDCGPEAINDAVARAKETAESGVWSGMPDYDRAKVLWRVADLIDENADDPRRARIAQRRYPAGAGADHHQGRVGVVPLLRGLVHQDRRHRARREHRWADRG